MWIIYTTYATEQRVDKKFVSKMKNVNYFFSSRFLDPRGYLSTNSLYQQKYASGLSLSLNVDYQLLLLQFLFDIRAWEITYALRKCIICTSKTVHIYASKDP